MEKRNLETQITGKKARKLSKKKEKLEKLAGSSREDFAEGRLAELEPCQNSRTVQNGTSPRRSYMTVGGIPDH
jgi:hypothetical protein